MVTEKEKPIKWLNQIAETAAASSSSELQAILDKPDDILLYPGDIISTKNNSSLIFMVICDLSTNLHLLILYGPDAGGIEHENIPRKNNLVATSKQLLQKYFNTKINIIQYGQKH